MEEDGKHEQGSNERIVEAEEEEIVDATYGEKNKRPSSRSANDRNTVEGEKDYPASTSSKISSKHTK